MSDNSKFFIDKAQEPEAEAFLAKIAATDEQTQRAVLAFIRGVQFGKGLADEQKGA